MLEQQPPPGWGRDEITKFLDASRANSYATFANLKAEYAKLLGLDAANRTLVDNLLNTKDWFAGFFVLRAHSSFLAGVRLALSGQVPEAYAALRLSLEEALYGFYLSKNPASRETWLRRHDSAEHKSTVRAEFKIRNLFDALKAANKIEAKAAGTLYDRTIDYGAHPNERALMQALQMNKGVKQTELKVIYLMGDGAALRLCLKTAAQVGVCALGIFRLVFKERFDLVGLTNVLDQLRKDL